MKVGIIIALVSVALFGGGCGGSSKHHRAQAASGVPGSATTLSALKSLPLSHLPAILSRGPSAERGRVILVPAGASSAMQLSTQARSESSGAVGDVTKSGNELVIHFARVTYLVDPIRLPGGASIPTEKIALDPSRASALSVNLSTGKIVRDFHWLLSAPGVTYNGKAALPLNDNGQSGVAGVTKLSPSRFAIHLISRWQTQFTLHGVTVNGTAPALSGRIMTTASWDGQYVLTFVR